MGYASQTPVAIANIAQIFTLVCIVVREGLIILDVTRHPPSDIPLAACYAGIVPNWFTACYYCHRSSYWLHYPTNIFRMLAYRTFNYLEMNLLFLFSEILSNAQDFNVNCICLKFHVTYSVKLREISSYDWWILSPVSFLVLQPVMIWKKAFHWWMLRLGGSLSYLVGKCRYS